MSILDDVNRALRKYNVYVTNIEVATTYSGDREFKVDFNCFNPYPFLERIAKLDEPEPIVIQPVEPVKCTWEFCEKCLNHEKVNDDLSYCNAWNNFTDTDGHCYKFKPINSVDNSV